MHDTRSTLMILIVLSFASTATLAQQINPNHKFAWGENVGFFNFADAGNPPGSQGVVANPDHLQGFVWGENVGWINLGNGAGPYANTTGLNFGVNRNTSTGHLSGFAWGENIGWINFAGGALASPPNPARIEAGRFRGYAWGENIGWINLDDPNVFVGFACPADLTGPALDGTPDGTVNAFDLNYYLTLWLAADPAADLTGPALNGIPDGAVNAFDLNYYLNLWLNNQGPCS